jgi:hypothetical protein
MFKTFKKIDIYTKGNVSNCHYVKFKTTWVYECSTNTSKTCKDAKYNFCKRHYLDISQVKANFSK